MSGDKQDRYRNTYREEAAELLAELESSLMELEHDLQDMDIISRVFRALHTIKGSGSMFGFDDVAEFAHDVENVFELIRNKKIDASQEIIDLSLKSCDHIAAMLTAAEGGEPVDADAGEAIRKGLARFIPEEPAIKPVQKAQAASPQKSQAEIFAQDEPFATEGITCADVTYRITFHPSPELFRQGIRPLLMIDDLKRLGPSYVFAHTTDIPALDEIEPETCYTHWDVILTTSKGIESIKDIFMFVEDDSDIRIDVLDDGSDDMADNTEYKKLGEILVDRGDIDAGEFENVLNGRRRIGEFLIESGLARVRSVESALGEQRHVQKIRKERKLIDQAATIRVPSIKLDRLVDLVGELVTVQARLSQISNSRKRDTELLSIAEEVERLSSELHDNTLSIRMVPIGTTFSKFRRLVRDLSQDLGRRVNLQTQGAETELDKTVIERLNDPLVHLIRNCIDHGIEPPDVREASGKAREGIITLSASHAGAEVHIKIIDDGAGLDLDTVRAKAVSQGLIGPEDETTDHELMQLIFAPGFSTAKKVTDVSGRGVGMDVVKRSIEALRGTVDVQSVRGAGTTITLKIPLTLAIIEGLLVKVQSNYFILPLSVVEECVELGAKEIRQAHQRHLVNVRGDMVPYIRLRERFGFNGERPEMEQVVIIKADASRIGVAVDHVIGEHQTVIKSLSRIYKNIRGVSGATILGDGTVALILDTLRLIEEAEMDELNSLA